MLLLQVQMYNPRHICFYRYWPEVPYFDIDQGIDLQNERFQNIDFVASVCPCAGLSMLNTSKGKKGRSADAAQNMWMYKSSEFVLANIKPKVLSSLFGRNPF